MGAEPATGLAELRAEVEQLRKRLQAQFIATRIAIVIGTMWAFGFVPGLAALALLAVIGWVADAVTVHQMESVPSTQTEPDGQGADESS